MTQPSTHPDPQTTINEDDILEYIDVLGRTSTSLTAMLRVIDGDDNRQMLARDVEVLTELQQRIWRQFTPVFVDVLN